MTEASPTTEANPRPKRGRLWRWTKRVAIVFVILLVLLRLTLQFWLPSALDAAFSGMGVHAEYEDFELSLLGGELELRHVDLRNAASAESVESAPLLHVEYARLDVDVSALCLFDLRVHRVEVDGVDIALERGPDGEWVLPEAPPTDEPAEAVAEAAPDPEPEPDSVPAEPWDLSSPVRLDAFRAQHVRLHVVDPSNALDAWLELNLRVSDIRHPDRKARLTAQVLGGDLLDAATVDADLEMRPERLTFDADCALRGLHLASCATLARRFGLDPVARSIDGTTKIRVAVESARDHAQLSAQIAVEDVELSADGSVAIGIEAIGAELDVLPERTTISDARITGVRAAALRLPTGVVRVAGIDLVSSVPNPVGGPGPDAVPAAEPVSEPRAEPAAAPSTDSAAASWLVEHFEVTDVALDWSDAAVTPASTIRATVGRLSVDGLGPERRAAIAIEGALDPAVGRWAVDGSLALDAAGNLQSAFQIVAETIDTVGLDPWLHPLGLAGDTSNATFGLSVELSSSTTVVDELTRRTEMVAVVRDLGLRAGDSELFAMDTLEASLQLDDRSGRLSAARLAGIRVSIDRDVDGRAHVLGLRTRTRVEIDADRPARPTQPSAVVAASAPVAVQPGPTTEPMAWFLDKIDVEGTSLRLVDASREDLPPRELVFDVGAAIRDLAIGQREPRDASIELSLGCEKVGAIRVSTAVHSRPGPLDLDAEVDVVGERLDWTHLSAYLADFGVTPTLQGGSLAARIEASVKSSPVDGLVAALRVADVVLRQQEVELVGIDSVDVPGFRVAPRTGAVEVDPVRVAGVRAALRRDTAGILHAAGIALTGSGSTPDGSEQPVESAPASAVATPPVSAVATSPASADETAPAAVGPSMRVAGFELSGVAVTWLDEYLGGPEPASTTVSASLRTGAIELGGTLDLDVRLRVDRALDELGITGTVGIDPDAPRVALQVAGRGLRGAGFLDRYLGEGQSLALVDGRIDLRVTAAVDPAEEGGLAVTAGVSDLTLREGEAGAVLLGAREIAIDAPRIDPTTPGGAILVERLVAKGLRLDIRQRDGGWEAAGLRVEPVSPPSAETSEGAAATSTPPLAPEQPVATRRSTTTRTVAASSVPSIEVRHLEVEVESLSVVEDGAEPIVAELSFANVEPVHVLGPEPEELPAWKFELAANAGDALESLRIAIDASPWQFDPSLTVDVFANGISGAAIQAALPEATRGVDLLGIDGGSFRAGLEARLGLRRRDPTEFDLSRGFGLEFELSDVEYRAIEGGPILAGVQSIFLEAPKIGGPSGNLHVTELAIQGITARIDRDAEGLGVLGVRIPNAVPDADSETATTADPDDSVEVRDPADQVSAVDSETVDPAAADPAAARRAAADPAAADPAAAEPAAAEPAAAEPAAPDPVAADPATPEAGGAPDEAVAPSAPVPWTRIDRIDVHGLDFVLEDTSAEPALLLPIDELSISVEGLRIGGDSPPPPARFEVLLGTSDISLPVRRKASSALAGFLGAAGRAVVGMQDEVEFEERPLLGELVIKGEIVPSSPPRGTVAVDMSRLELLGLRGPANAGGVEISDGTFDMKIGLELQDSGATQTDAVFTFTDLGLDEPPGGPISTYLKLPAPLQTVLFVLKNSDDEIRAPLSVSTSADGGVSASAIAGSAIAAFGAIVTDAIASSATRVGGSVTGLFGFGGPTEIPAEANVLLEFDPGSADLPANMETKLATLLELLDDDEFEVVVLPVLGELDLERASVLANPDSSDRLALVQRLRDRKRALWRQRDLAANELRARVRLGDASKSTAVQEQLRALDADLAVTERALDKILALLRPGADKSSDRRARRLALQLADARADALRRFFTEIGGAEMAARLQVRRARFPESDDAFARGFLGLSPRQIVQ